MGERLKKVKLLEDLKEMNVLGIIFDSKLQWTSQVANTISKAKNISKYVSQPHTSNAKLRVKIIPFNK